MLKRLIRKLHIAHYPYKPFMHKHKCIFVHVPKNAGSSVLKCFKDTGGRKHAKWYDFYESNDYFFERYHKFAIIREPLERLYSAYCYSVNGGNQSEDDIALKQTLNKNSQDFESFVEEVLDKDFVMLQLLFNPQYLFVFNRRLECMMNSLLRFENLEGDWCRLAEKQNLPKTLPQVNAGLRKSTMPRISEATFLKVVDLYKMDFELLGYSSNRDRP